MNATMSMIWKESLQIIRDPSAIIIAFVLPLLLLFIFGFGVNLDSNKIKIGVVLEERTPDIISFTTALMNSRFLDVKIGYDRREFSEQLSQGEIRGIVIIPQDFNVNGLLEEKKSKIQVIADGAEPNIASFVQNYTKGVMQVWFRHQARDRAIEIDKSVNLEVIFWFNPELKSRNFLIPGSISIIMTLIGTLLTALVIAREWERGTMEALMSTPITIGQILIGKIVPYFLLALGSMIICWLVAKYLYGVPFRGSFFALCLTTAVFLFAALGQGLLISTIAKDQFVASQLALMSAFLPSFMLSGFIFEISAMPKPIQWLTYLFPARYFVTSLQTLFLVGDIWSLLLKSMAAMMVISLLLFGIIIKYSAKRLD